MADRSQYHRWNEVMSWALIFFALILALALFTYDRDDLSSNRYPPNSTVHNFMGVFGARIASSLFFALGAAAYTLPVLALAFGLAGFVDALRYLRGWRSSIGVAGLMISITGYLQLFHGRIPSLGLEGESLGPGGLLGWSIHRYFFAHFFNDTGASLFYGIIYFWSLLLLTDFHLVAWFRQLMEPRSPEAKLAAQEKALRKQARELERRQRQLTREAGQNPEPTTESTQPAEKRSRRSESQPAKAGKDSDVDPEELAAFQNLPEPTVRDLSVPQTSGTWTPPTRSDDDDDPSADSSGSHPEDSGRFRSLAERILGRKPSGKSEANIFAAKNTEPDSEEPAPTQRASRSRQETRRSTAPRPEVSEEALVPEDPGMDPDAEMEASVEYTDQEPSKSGPELEEDEEVPTDSVPATPRGRMLPRRNKPITVSTAPIIGDYQLPGIDLLHFPDVHLKPTESKEELVGNARLMVQTLAQFGIEVAPGDITKGPTITRYELHPAPGVKLEKIAALTNNMAAALKAERLNILAPIPGKSSVGVEVPNSVKTKVIMRELMESSEWHHSRARVPLALGKDVYGHPIIADLADMPHLLIAGSTGSGKSVCINTIIASLLFRFTPDQLRFVMIDPKVVELQQYNTLPHLVVPVVTDPKKVVLALRWVVNEMEKRYQIFAKVGVRNVKAFNERPRHVPEPDKDLPASGQKDKEKGDGVEGFAVEVDEQIVVPREDDILIPEKLSYIVVIIDELADLMLVAPADVEMLIARITQMARAAGIHCIVATQRPSVDVITGVIKANIPARIAFQVASKVDSRTILDQMGADKLLGKGDMFYLPPGSAKMIRAQGALITDEEIDLVVKHIARQGKPSYDQEIHRALQKAAGSAGPMPIDPGDEASSADEEIIQRCIEVIRTEKKASVSLLQRRLRLGYGRAARLMDELEDRGVVGPSKGAEPRDILMDLDGEGYDGGGQQMV